MRLLRTICSPFTYIQLLVNFKFKLAGLKEYTIETDEFIINYWDNKSDKPTLVLIQAFAAESKYSWHKQVMSLRKDFRLIIPNLLYFGKSRMKGVKAYSMQNQIAAIKEILDSNKIDNAIFCGASIGGVIATEFADKYPAAVSKLVMTNSPLKYDDDRDIQSIVDQFNLKTKEDLLVPNTPSDLHRLFGISYFKRPPIPMFVFKDIHAQLYKNKEDKRKLVHQSSIELELLRKKEYHFQQPILLIWGERDLLCPRRIGENLKNYFGENCRLEIVPKTAHMPNFEKPRTYNKILKRFLLS